MCLIAFAWHGGSPSSLVLIANRDEMHARESDALQAWPSPSAIVAGRDRQAGGTWMGVHESGRFAAVTNVRDGRRRAARLSRGALASNYLDAGFSAQQWIANWQPRASEYGPCNLLLGDREALWFASNALGLHAQRVSDGVHALSNASLDTPWPKTETARQSLQNWLDRSPADRDPEMLFRVMRDERRAPDAQLPDTGVGLELERRLSPPFIAGEVYGTRCTTWLQIGGDGDWLMQERRYGPMGRPEGADMILSGRFSR